MPETKINPIIRFMPSLTDLVFLAPIVIVLGMGKGASSLLEGDTGWHIRAGEWMLQNRQVADKDFFSYTKSGEPWVAMEWLWEVLFALLHQYGGMAAVILTSLLVIGLTMALVFRMTRSKCNNALIAFAVTGLAMGASSIHWLARPHLAGWLFLVVFYWIIDRAKDGNTKLLWALPFLTVLWTNIHGSFFLGIVLLATYAAGELAAGIFTSDAGGFKSAALRARPYILAAVGCALASLVNPFFYHLHLHIAGFLRESYYLNNIDEYRPTALRGGVGQFLELLLMLGLIAAVWNARKRRFVYTILLLSWMHFGMIAIRNVPIFAMIAAPLIGEMLAAGIASLKELQIARWLKTLGREFQEISAEIGVMERPWRLHLLSIAVVLAVVVLLYAPTPAPNLRVSYDSKLYPEAALGVLRGEPSEARIFTDDEWGDFLIYRLYPDRKVFVDGRADMYGAKFGRAYLDVLGVTYDWETKLAAQRVDTVLLSTKSALAATLKESRRWRVVYDDGLAIIFRKAVAEQVSESSIQVGEIRGLVPAEGSNSGAKPLTNN